MTSPRPPLQIADYGLIGNCQTVALGGNNGSIDWCCFPRYDSPSVFAGVLDPDVGGTFSVSVTSGEQGTQRYVHDSNVLITEFETATGAWSLTDCMPFYESGDWFASADAIIRKIDVTRGVANVRVTFAPKPDYARGLATLKATADGLAAEWDETKMDLSGPGDWRVIDNEGITDLTLSAGESAVFVLTHDGPGTIESRLSDPPELAIVKTNEFWAEQVQSLDIQTKWRESVARSYLALRLLTYVVNGGIVAAPTTSLPEAIGGERNWDYRYTWLRDASFTVDARLAVGHSETALSYFQWLCTVCSRDWESFQIMYRIDGTTDLAEESLLHLAGYQHSSPVRIGNNAADQFQHDIYGEVLGSAARLADAHQDVTGEHWPLLRTLANHAADRWGEPDNGIWEVRGGPFHFVYSKVMCWVALDRAIRLAENVENADGDEVAHWRVEAEAIRAEVLNRGWSESKQAFVQHFDSEAMDASNLLLPLVGFIDADDPRMVSTVDRIMQELVHGPFVSRYRTDETDDGLTGSEGAFALCTFWLVRVLTLMGRRDQALALFEQMLTCASPVGLYAEMKDPETGELLGNYPQAFTHIGLILAARDLTEA